MKLVVNKAYKTVMSLAKDPHNPSSDIVIEEDLADVFGRSRISPQFVSSFATVIKKDGTTLHNLQEGIGFVGGLGPTVGRALQRTPSFSTVVQLAISGNLSCSNNNFGPGDQRCFTKATGRRLWGGPDQSSTVPRGYLWCPGSYP